MSNAKRGYILIAALLAMVAFFAFGCKAKTPVEKISLDLSDFGEQKIVLLINESYTPKVEISPSYATDKGYSISSEDKNVVAVDGKTIRAVGAGSTRVRISADDNPKIEIVTTVTVRATITNLVTPTNLSYDNRTQTISFNAVSNAAGYTLNINNNEISLGNTTHYGLDAYAQKFGENVAYDNNLTIKVRADAPKFGRAFISSQYTDDLNALTIYQTKAVDNVVVNTIGHVSKLTFSHDIAQRFRIYINGDLFKTISTQSLDLMDLPTRYAGQTVQLQIEALLDNAGYGAYSSFSEVVPVYVLDFAKIQVKDNLLSWDVIKNSDGYNITVDGAQSYTTNNTTYDPSTFNLQNSSNNHSLTVEPILSGNNLAKVAPGAEAQIQFNFTPNPQIHFENGALSWDDNERGFYLVGLSKEDQIVYGPQIKEDSSFNYDFEIGVTYEFSIVALGGYADGVYYFNSAESSRKVQKENFENYNLALNLEVGKTYDVLLDENKLNFGTISGGSCSDGVLTPTENVVKIDFSNINVDAGSHTLSVESVDTNDIIFAQFVQLEQISSGIVIDNGNISIQPGEINDDENIKLAIYANSESEVLKYNNLPNNYTLNSTNKDGEQYLEAGEYVVKAFVVGNGSTTFSVKNSGQELAVAQTKFKVLQAPQLALANRDQLRISFDAIADAANYKFVKVEDGNEQTTDGNLYFDYTLNEGSVTFKSQSLGDGSSTIDSCFTDEFKVTRLLTPSLIYNKLSNKFELNDRNLSEHQGAVKNYTITTLDGTESSEIDSINDFSYEFKSGENIFTIKANANTDGLNEQFLNSLETSLIITKIDIQTSLSVESNDPELQIPYPTGNFYNFLKITTDEVIDANEYILILKFDIDGKEIEFKQEGSELKSADGKYSLLFVYFESSYYIQLVDQHYAPIIQEISALTNGKKDATTFKIYVKFDNVNNNIVASDFTKANEVKALGQSGLSRVAGQQQLLIENIDKSRNEFDYELLLDNNYQICLEPVEISDFVIDLSYIKDYYETYYSSTLSSGEHSLKVITCSRKIGDSYEGLATLSADFTFKLAQEITLRSTKNETQAGNNSVVISFDELAVDYDKSYVVQLYTKQDEEELEIDKIQKSEVFSINLDDYNFEGVIYVRAYVETTAQDGGVEMFNSPNSNELSFTKIEQATNLRIVDNVLYFDYAEDKENLVSFYEVWAKSGLENTLLETSAAKNYELSEDFETAELFVKAISKEKVESEELGTVYYSNSSLSEDSVMATKITISADIIKGDFVITTANLPELLDELEAGNCYLYVKNGQREISLNYETDGVTFEVGESNIKICVEAHLLLNYVNTEILTFQIRSQNDTTFVNSSIIQLNGIKGLDVLTDLRLVYTQVKDEESADRLTWKDSNSLDNNDEYRVVVKYQDLVLDSSKGEFYYYGNLISITNTGMFVPTSYKYSDKDEIVYFNKEKIEIAIKVVPTAALGANYACSKYVKTELEILNTPNSVSIQEGKLVWAPDEKAESYMVRVYTVTEGEKETWTYETIETTNAFFDFEIPKLSNSSAVLGFEVQAVSKKKNVQEDEILKNRINSVYSNMLLAYRLAEVESASVDDGTLKIKANQYFTKAEIVFVDVNNGQNTDTFTFINPNPLDIPSTNNWHDLLKNGSLTEWMGESNYQTYYIKINGSEILNLPEDCGYTVNIRLIGNSSNDEDLPFLSSKQTTTVSNLRATKPKKNSLTSAAGELVFATDQTYDYNYNFNLQSLNDLEQAGIIYKISLTSGDESRPRYDIYALDYNYFKLVESSIESSAKVNYGNSYYGLYASYILGEAGNQFYLDVYTDNKISFKNATLRYHKTNVLSEDDGLTYHTENSEPDSIDLSASQFEIAISILGGDSKTLSNSDSVAYLTSNAVVKSYYRYGENIPYARNGELIFTNLLPYDDMDVPVYKIVCQSADARVSHTFYLYYNGHLDEAQAITGEQDRSKFIELQTMENNDQLIYFEISPLLEQTNIAYIISIQTLAGMGTENNWLDSLIPTYRKTFYKLQDRAFTTNTTVGLVLETELSYITTSSVARAYTKRYEVTLTDLTLGTEPIVYVIDETSVGVEIKSRMVNGVQNQYLQYSLPEEIMVNGEPTKLSLTSNYSIKIRPLADNSSPASESMLNGEYLDNNLVVRKQQTVLEQKIEEGVLKFRLENDIAGLRVAIKLNYDGGKSITIRTSNLTKDAEGFYIYKFNDSNYEVDNSGTTAAIDFGIEYMVQIAVDGYSLDNVLFINSDYCEQMPLTRLERVSKIVAVDGVLTWTGVNGANMYEVTVNGNKFTTTTGVQLDLTQSNIAAGEISISIRALSSGDGKDSHQIDAMNSLTATFIKLGEAKNINMQDESTTITWQEVEGATLYFVTVKYNNDVDYKEEYVETPAFDLSDVAGLYTLTIQAIGQANNQISGEIVEFVSSIARPHPVENFVWDDEHHRFVITPSSDFYSGDELRITYFISSISGSQSTVIKHDGSTNYYFYPTIIGTYSNVTVVVKRMGGGISDTVMLGEDVNFDIFDAGQGTDDNPYEIKTVDHFKNIKLFPNAKYKLTGPINLSDVEILNGCVVEEFGGVLDGNNYYIYGTIQNVTNFALFKNLNGATIKNLTIGSQNSVTSITANYSNGREDVNLAFVANNATNATLQCVDIVNVTISATGTLYANFYFAGLINQANNTIIEGSHISLNVSTFNITSSSEKYVAGLVSVMNGGEIRSFIQGSERNTSIDFQMTMQSGQTSIVSYIGGAVAYATNNAKLTNIVASNVVLNNINAINCGGLVGYIQDGTISSCEVNSNISTVDLNTSTNQHGYNIGGLAGYAGFTSVQNCTSNTTFTINVQVLSSGKINIGLYVGNLENSNVTFEASQTNVTTGLLSSFGNYGKQTGTSFNG